MINLDTLDTVIAIVIVVLVFSLIVQAIQSFIKKPFKIKSGTILTSLEDRSESRTSCARNQIPRTFRKRKVVNRGRNCRIESQLLEKE